MMRVDHLHLDHVVQTVCVLESVIHRSFGPEGGQVLFTRDTGQAMLTRSGIKILTALRLEHPQARMVVECVLKYSNVAGDGSKTFILLLASLLRMIHTTACKEPNMSHTYNSREAAKAATARLLADKLLLFALKELDDLIAVGVVPYGCSLAWEDLTATHLPVQTNSVESLLKSFFLTRLGQTHCDFFSSLTYQFISNWKSKNDPPSSSLQFVNDNMLGLYTPVSGFPLSCSRLIEGQVIHRDFATPCPQTIHQPVKAVVFTGYLQPKMLSAGEALKLGCDDQGLRVHSGAESSILHFSAWAERSLESVIAKLHSLGVSVLLSAVKQSAAVLSLAAQADICIVECISEDELSLFIQLSGATPVSDCWRIEPAHVATLTFCRPILLGAHRYVHVAFHDSEKEVMVKLCSLVICGAGEGQTDQYACALQDAIRMLLLTWKPTGIPAPTVSKRTLQSNNSTSSLAEKLVPIAHSFEPSCVIPAGGTFEFLLNHALLKHGSSCSGSNDPNMNIPAVSQLLANALLSVPRQIYYHDPRHFLQTQTKLLSFIQHHFQPFSHVSKQEHNTILIQGLSKGECPREEGKQSMHCCREADVSTKVFMLDLGLESVSFKYQLLVAVLQCLSSLLHVDTVLHVRTAFHTNSQRLANISVEGTEDEDED